MVEGLWLWVQFSLQSLNIYPRKWLKSCFYKITIDRISSYLAELILSDSHLYNTESTRNITTYFCRADASNYSFFSWLINEWNKHNS